MNGHAPSIKVTKRTDRSSLVFAAQHAMKPIGSRLAGSDKVQPAGSPKLEPGQKVTKRCDVQERVVKGIHIYDLVPREAPPSTTQDAGQKKQKKRVYYMCGGSWRQPPSSDHWTLLTELAVKLADTVVSIISTPLAPHSPAPVAFPQLMEMYDQILHDAETAGERVIFAGDSSGGNVAIALALERLREGTAGPQPSALFIMCPSVDLRKVNPDMREVEKHDPLLTIASSTESGNLWRGAWDAADPRVSPLLADVSSLAGNGIHVHGLTGGYDILTPDALLLRNKLEEAHVQGEWLDWDKQMHCFPLAFSYKLPEAVEGKDWILDVLRRS